jgi:hypothetical protein
MNEDERHGHGRSEGPHASLHDAIANAWDDAKGKNLPAGRYVVDEIEIETTNPIHAYVVKIRQADD